MRSPNKFYQSIMARIPILASDYDRLPELIMHGKYGQLGAVVNPSDPGAIAKKVLEITSPEAKSRIEKNLEQAAVLNSWETEAKKLIGIYREISRL